jgi:hypothetical protein
MDELFRRVAALGLLKPGAPLACPAGLADADLLQLCNAGLLDGGLTVALDVQPDELIGPLATTAGGRARLLKVIEVREKPAEMVLSLTGSEHRWTISGLVQLVDQFNALFESDASVKAVVVLGDWEEALQLWSLRKVLLPKLLLERFFSPLNLSTLRALSKKITSP